MMFESLHLLCLNNKKSRVQFLDVTQSDPILVSQSSRHEEDVRERLLGKRKEKVEDIRRA